jgi:isoleucyl-tRNA synthetase
MSSFYLDVLKDRLYTYRPDSTERHAAQWVFSQILLTLTRLMAPIVSFTAEEVWQEIRKREHGEENLEESVFLAQFPEFNEKYYDQDLEKRWHELFLLRNEVNKALEIRRAEKFIGNSLEAKIILSLPGKYKDILSNDRDFMQIFFIVSAVEISDSPRADSYKSAEIEGLEITVERAPGAKCQRCWNWSEFVGTFENAPEVCERCHKVIFANT